MSPSSALSTGTTSASGFGLYAQNTLVSTTALSMLHRIYGSLKMFTKFNTSMYMIMNSSMTFLHLKLLKNVISEVYYVSKVYHNVIFMTFMLSLVRLG